MGFECRAEKNLKGETFFYHPSPQALLPRGGEDHTAGERKIREQDLGILKTGPWHGSGTVPWQLGGEKGRAEKVSSFAELQMNP